MNTFAPDGKKPSRGAGRVASAVAAVFTFAGALLCVAGLSSCETYPKDNVAAIVTAQYPGKREVDQCSPYANALYDALKANHVEAWKIGYMGGEAPSQYYHAMVVYKNAGAYWYVDNIFPYPTKTTGKTPRQWVQDRDPRMIVVTTVEFDGAGAETTALPAVPVGSGTMKMTNDE